MSGDDLMDMAITSLRIEGLLVFVWLHTRHDPSPQEWNAAFELMDVRRAQANVTPAEIRQLVISDGGVPGGVQRARMGRDYPCLVSVISTMLANPIKRGVATALGWVNPKFLFCEPHELSNALQHIGLAGKWSELGPAFQELQQFLPANKTLEQVIETANRR
jgi:hypothetical protein